MPRTRVYCLIAEDVEVRDLEPISPPTLEAALDNAIPGWRDRDSPLSCDFSSQHVSFSIFFSRAAEIVPRIASACRTAGLTVFDPQLEEVPAAETRFARKLRAQEAKSLRQQEVEELRRCAEAGDAKAQLDLANRISSSAKTKKSLGEAYEWYRRSAEAGNVDAAFNVAACLQYGDGVKADIQEAIRWYRRAAEHDKTYAPFALGEIHLGWRGLERDDALAERYFLEALDNGHPDAQAALDLLCEPVIALELKKLRWKFWNPRS